jgi:hypothetical protein
MDKNKIKRVKKIFFCVDFWALQETKIFAGACELLA